MRRLPLVFDAERIGPPHRGGKGPPHLQSPDLKINVIPLESQQLSLPEAGGNGQDVESFEAVASTSAATIIRQAALRNSSRSVALRPPFCA